MHIKGQSATLGWPPLVRDAAGIRHFYAHLFGFYYFHYSADRAKKTIAIYLFFKPNIIYNALSCPF
jgi:hypothetical protein